MTDVLGTTGLILNEPLLWDKGKRGRRGFSLPVRDVEVSPLEESLAPLARTFRISAKWMWFATSHDSRHGTSVWTRAPIP